MTVPRPRSRQPKKLDAGTFQAEIASFRLHLAAAGKAARTIRTYTEAVQWFAAACLPGPAGDVFTFRADLRKRGVAGGSPTG